MEVYMDCLTWIPLLLLLLSQKLKVYKMSYEFICYIIGPMEIGKGERKEKE